MVRGPGNTSDMLGFRGGGRLGAKAAGSCMYFEFICIGEVTRAQTHAAQHGASFMLEPERRTHFKGALVCFAAAVLTKPCTSSSGAQKSEERRCSQHADTYGVSDVSKRSRATSNIAVFPVEASRHMQWLGVADEVAHSPTQRLAYISSLRLNTSLCSVWAQMEM